MFILHRLVDRICKSLGRNDPKDQNGKWNCSYCQRGLEVVEAVNKYREWRGCSNCGDRVLVEPE
jgi:DNA-directed RNA polymerase subunit RPC12/RpoP